MGPGGPNMQYVMPMPQRQGPGQRGRGGRGGQGGGRGQGRQNMRFNPNMGQPPAPLPGAPPPGEPVEANPVALLAAQLPTATPEMQRSLLGEALYPLVDAIEPASSAKITGMLLEMDQSEVLTSSRTRALRRRCRRRSPCLPRRRPRRATKRAVATAEIVRERAGGFRRGASREGETTGSIGNGARGRASARRRRRTARGLGYL